MPPDLPTSILRGEVQWDEEEERKHVLERIPIVRLDIRLAIELISLYNKPKIVVLTSRNNASLN